jgi:sec-independent protein translocase protein TatA
MIGAGGPGAAGARSSHPAQSVAEEIMFGLGVQELLLIFVILVLIFGTSRIPELGRGLGEGIKNFKKSIKGDEEPEKKH